MQLGLPLQVFDPQEPASPQRLSRESVVFVRHRRARRYILRVLETGTLRVTLPRWGSKREAQAFIERSAPWIAKQRELAEARPIITHRDEPALRRRAGNELPPALLALAGVHDV